VLAVRTRKKRSNPKNWSYNLNKKNKLNCKEYYGKKKLTYIVLKIIFENNKIKFVLTIKIEILEEKDGSPKNRIGRISKNVTIIEETDVSP